MKKLLLTLGLMLLAPLAIAGHHVNGSWSMDVDLGGQGGTAAFELEEGEGGTLTGTYTGALGNSAVSGTVKGMAVEFSFDSQAGKVTYKGTVSGDSMTGTCNYGMVGEGTFEGAKS